MKFFIFGLCNLAFLYFLFKKSGSNIHNLDNLAEYICQKFKIPIFGNKLKLLENVKIYSESGNDSETVKKTIEKNCKYYLILMIALIIVSLAIGTIEIAYSKQIDYLSKPKIGASEKKISVAAEVVSENGKYNQVLLLNVKPEAMSVDQQIESLNKFINKVPAIIVGENKNLVTVSKSLNLIKNENIDGITINWQSSNTKLIGNDGFVYALNLERPTKVILTATFKLLETEILKDYPIIVVNQNDEKYIGKIISRGMSDIKENIEGINSGKFIFLPEYDKFGNQINWYISMNGINSNICILFLAAFVYIYINRHRKVQWRAKKYRESIIKELPGFVSKFVLLVNAGMVVSSALEKMAKDYEKNTKKQFVIPIYEELLKIEHRITQSNSSLATELKNLGDRTRVRELSRFASIISENINKGSELVEKLESEGDMLWLNRKKRIEERAKLADTKLTLPLVILLITLITITIAPALISF
ncbi:MAG: type II secretion system F family protein [Eubacteriales bacterium]